MAKLKPDEIPERIIRQYLLEKDDFAFELRCLQELTARSLRVSHGGTYSDPVTNKPRQFDFQILLGPSLPFRISIALECKNLKKNFPLLVSRVPRRDEEANHQLLVGPMEEGYPILKAIAHCERLVITSSLLYPRNDLVGKSTVQIGVNQSGELHGDDAEVHEKWSQAVSSAYSLISDASSELLEEETKAEAWFIVPMVVVPDGVLWAQDYKTDGVANGVPHLIEETTFFIDHAPWRVGQMFGYTFSHLHFVTLTGLIRLLDRLTKKREFYEGIFKEN